MAWDMSIWICNDQRRLSLLGTSLGWVTAKEKCEVLLNVFSLYSLLSNHGKWKNIFSPNNLFPACGSPNNNYVKVLFEVCSLLEKRLAIV